MTCVFVLLTIHIIIGKGDNVVNAKDKCIAHRLRLAKKTHCALYPMESIINPKKGEMIADTV